MSARVQIDRVKVRQLVDRQILPGAERAARFMAAQQRQRIADVPEVASAIYHESGRDVRGVYARAGVGPVQPARRWHRYTDGRWEIIPWPARRTAATSAWRLFEFATPRTRPRPFIRPSFFSNTARVARMLCGR